MLKMQLFQSYVLRPLICIILCFLHTSSSNNNLDQRTREEFEFHLFFGSVWSLVPGGGATEQETVWVWPDLHTLLDQGIGTWFHLLPEYIQGSLLNRATIQISQGRNGIFVCHSICIPSALMFHF